MRAAILAIALAWVTTPSLGAQLEFIGAPAIRIEISNGLSSSSSIEPLEAKQYRATVIREGDQYFSAREGKAPMIRVESGDYVTYVAATGEGYIRTLSPAAREMFDQLPAEAQAKEFTYTEHLLHQLGSTTYFGR